MMTLAPAHSFKAQAVVVANRVQRELTGRFDEVQKLVDDNQIVFAIWQDAAEPDGVGMLIIKGQQHMREIVASAQSRSLAWTAIPCIEAAQAYALKQVAGEADGRH